MSDDILGDAKELKEAMENLGKTVSKSVPLLNNLFPIITGLGFWAPKRPRDPDKKHPFKIIKTHVDFLSWERRKYLRSLCPPPFLDYGWVIAGGCLRNLIVKNETIRDVDIFRIRDNKHYGEPHYGHFTDPYSLVVKTCGKNFTKKNDYIWEIDWKEKHLQIIRPKNASSVEDLLRGFDLNGVCFAFDGEWLYWTKQGVKDLHHKSLTINNMKNPIGTLNRLARYHSDYNYDVKAAHKEIVNNLNPNFKMPSEDYFC